MSGSFALARLAWTTAVLVTSLHAQMPRPGVDCGCPETGPYVAPAVRQVAWNTAASPDGSYQARPWPGRLGLEVLSDGRRVLNVGPFVDPLNWGFGPGNDALVLFVSEAPAPGGGPVGYQASLHNLSEPARTPWRFHGLVKESHAVFSPRGRHLLHATLDGQGTTHLRIVDVRSLQETVSMSFRAVARPGTPAQRLGAAAWGFSPDPLDATLLLARTAESGVRFDLFELTRGERVLGNESTATTATFQFSPCGDRFGVTELPAGGQPTVRLIKTLTGAVELSGTRLNPPFGGLASDADAHHALAGGGRVELAANHAGGDCLTGGLEPPGWPGSAQLRANPVRDTSLTLTWDAARPGDSPLTQYEVWMTVPTETSLASLPADAARRIDVRDLEPETDHAFAVRARDLAGWWTAQSLTVTTRTRPLDAAPSWPLGATLRAAAIGETDLRLEWDAAVDDQGITQYRLFQDDAPIATVAGHIRTCPISDLAPASRYRFRVEAGDAEGQWSWGLSLSVMTVDTTPPDWPPGSGITLAGRGDTHLELEWPPAIDNVGVAEYRIHVRRAWEWHLIEILGLATEFKATCLLPNSTFRFKVTARDESGNWSTFGLETTVQTTAGRLGCDRVLEVASVSSREEPATGEWYRDGIRDWGRWNAAASNEPALSANGRFVAFSSVAVNLVPDDRNSYRLRLGELGGSEVWTWDVFVRDRWAGFTERLSVRSDGREAWGSSLSPALSADGRFVAFVSHAPLVESKHDTRADIFLRDRLLRTTDWIAERGNLSQTDQAGGAPALNADGSVLAFVSAASHLVEQDLNGVPDIFVHHRDTGLFRRVSVNSDGGEAGGRSWGPDLCAAGRRVVFASVAPNLVPDDTNGWADVFVHDLDTGETVRVSVASDGSQANGPSCMTRQNHGWSRPAISANGRFVVFDSFATNLVPDDTNDVADVFVRDLETGETTRVSLSSTGEQSTHWPGVLHGGDSRAGRISADGRHVVFLSSAPNLVPGDRNKQFDVFLRDRQTGTTERLNVCFCGEDITETRDGGGPAALSADGNSVAFVSPSPYLTPNLEDLNDSDDIFVWTRGRLANDRDGDGIPDSAEQGGDGSDPDYDGNGDDIPDWRQDRVVTVGGPHGILLTAALELPDPTDRPGYPLGDRLLFQPVATPSPATSPDLPIGCYQIAVHEAVEPGGAIQVVTWWYPFEVPFNTYYKYGRLPDSPVPRWYEFMYDGRTGAEIGPHSVTLHFVDGERGDDDRLANGTIVDPGGPARVGDEPPPRLDLMPDQIHLDAQTRTDSVTLRNIGGRPLIWAVAPPLPDWLILSCTRGALAPDEETRVTLQATECVVAGEYTRTLTFRSGGGSRELELRFTAPLVIEVRVWENGRGLEFGWMTAPGAVFRVQHCADLAAADWQHLSGPLVADGDRITWLDVPGSTARARFYRVTRDDFALPDAHR